MPVTANTTHTAPENRVFYPALDGLRAIAFFMVLGQHYMFLPWGWTGVNVFFVLSGFLITGILYDTRDDQYRARNFYVRRTLRIFPLYYGIAVVFLLLTPLFRWQWNLYWAAWPLYLGNFLRFFSHTAGTFGSPLELAADAHLRSPLMSHSEVFFGHFWSLCVEEQFYLFWPWVVFNVRSRRKLLWLCLAAVIIDPIARVIAASHAPAWMMAEELTYRVTPFQLDSLLLGALLALLWRGAHRDLLLRAARWVAALGLLVAALYIGHGLYLRHSFGGYVYPAWKQTWGLTYVNFIAGALILCALRPRTLTARLLGLSPLRWVGRISYGAYVYHDIFHFLFKDMSVNSHIAFVVHHQFIFSGLMALPFTLLIAWLSFRFFEAPFLNLKERYTIRNGA